MEEKAKKDLILSRNFRDWRFLLSAVLFLSIAIAIFWRPGDAMAASMYFSPSTGSYVIGKSFSVGVYVSSADQAANAFSGSLSFPTDKLQVVSVSKSGSMIGLWVQDPAFSNGAGTVNFEGVVFNPGYIGESGKILSVTFKVKSVGSANVNFTAGTILANNGLGTNILTGMGDANFELRSSADASPAEQSPAPSGFISDAAPKAPTVVSPNLPDSDKWYANNDPRFEWRVPPGTTGVSIALTPNKDSNPGSISDGIMSYYEYRDIQDGAWYFHVRLRNAAGWGPITHFKVNIDTTAPENFSVNFSGGEGTENISPIITFPTADVLSGLDHYIIKIDYGAGVTSDVASFTVPALSSGEHTVIVEAYDKANNFVRSEAKFIVDMLEPPKFTEYQHNLKGGELIVVKGTTYADAQVTININKDDTGVESKIIESDHWGDFTFVHSQSAQGGVYKIWGEVTDENGLKSGSSKSISIVVGQTVFGRLVGIVAAYLKLIVPVLILIVILAWFAIHFWKKMLELKKTLRKEVHEVEVVVDQSLIELMATIREEMRLLERAKKIRQLSKEEISILSRFKEILDTTEKAEKKLKKIEKKIE